ncbi:MAG: transporter suffix domain-containing protein, partial [Actinomycetota bacterium]|nr:transporter suffix domain-containing protein [Actinomycetota bacterium]
ENGVRGLSQENSLENRTNGGPNKRPDGGPHDAAGSGLPPAPSTGRRSSRAWVLVLGVFVVPSMLYAMLLVVPFLSLTTGQKVSVSTGLVVAAEGTFLISALSLGRQAVRRYRRFLNPRNYFGKYLN